MSWSCRAHATPASGTGITSALPMCSTCSRSLVLAGRLPSLPLSCCSSAPGHLPLAPPASAYLTHPFSAPGLSLLLAWPQLPSWHRARLHLTLLPSLFAPSCQVCAGSLGTEINILSPAFSASLLYLRGLGLHLGSGVLDGSDPVWALPVWVSVGGGTQQKGALPAERPS